MHVLSNLGLAGGNLTCYTWKIHAAGVRAAPAADHACHCTPDAGHCRAHGGRAWGSWMETYAQPAATAKTGSMRLIPVSLQVARTWEQREAGEQLGQDAGHAPHIDGRPIRQPQQHLRRAVEAALDVRVQPLILEAAAAKVDDLAQGP